MSLCNTCKKADVSCPIYPQETDNCVECAPVLTIQEQAAEKFGKDRQLHKYFEEIMECLVAYHRWKYNPCTETFTALAEEFADVEICTPYPRLYFGSVYIEEAKQAKLERLAETIEAG